MPEVWKVAVMNPHHRTFLILTVLCIGVIAATIWYVSRGTVVNGEVAPEGTDDIIIPIGADIIIIFQKYEGYASTYKEGYGTIYIQGYLGRNVVNDYTWKYEDYNWALALSLKVLFLWRD